MSRMKIQTVLDRARKSGGCDIMDSLVIATRGVPERGQVLNKSIMFCLSLAEWELGRPWFPREMGYNVPLAEQVFLDFAYHVAREEWP
jgi:hypothetical protein